jgi:hypothetical protein
MIVPADRGFTAGRLVKQIAGTRAHLLIRVGTGRSAPKLPALHRHRDGSFISYYGGIKVRVIDAGITVSTSTGHTTGTYRLITTLLDAAAHPATGLVRLYHQRWEIETTYLELKSTILGGRVLRARTPPGVDQEVYALLVVYQALRTAMADATSSDPRIDPDRAGFSTALATALLVAADSGGSKKAPQPRCADWGAKFVPSLAGARRYRQVGSPGTTVTAARLSSPL